LNCPVKGNLGNFRKISGGKSRLTGLGLAVVAVLRPEYPDTKPYFRGVEISSSSRALVKGPNQPTRHATANKDPAIKPKVAGRLVAIKPGMNKFSPTMLTRLQA